MHRLQPLVWQWKRGKCINECFRQVCMALKQVWGCDCAGLEDGREWHGPVGHAGRLLRLDPHHGTTLQVFCPVLPKVLTTKCAALDSQ